jgi:peptidoglycan/LPS O-acetylase OafA/YrhL
MSLTHSTEKFPVLDGLRAISILLVLGCHLLPLGPKAMRLNETAGAMGMSLFFALSGFLITSGLLRNPSISEFLVRRLARILPLAYAYAFTVLLLFSFEPTALLWTVLFLENYLTQFLTAWTGHLWSLCVEMHFYLLIAITTIMFGQKVRWILWMACLTVTLFRVNAGAYVAIETHLRVDEILAGACIAMLYPNRVKIKYALVFLIFASSLWALSSWPLVGAFQYFRPYATALFVLATLHYGTTNAANLLASRPLRYIATVSYALYVIHPATALGWMNEGSTGTRYLLKRPISFALTFLLAHLSTFYWENRWQSAARNWIKSRRSTRSPDGIIVPPAPYLKGDILEESTESTRLKPSCDRF